MVGRAGYAESLHEGRRLVDRFHDSGAVIQALILSTNP
jgi:hypothetical protein